MAFTIKGLTGDGKLPTSAKTDLAADLANPGTSTGSAVPRAVAADAGALRAADYGVSVAATAAVNTNALRTAVAEAQSQGRNLVLPPTGPGQTINVNGEILISGTGGIEVYTNGTTDIRQTVKPNPIFRVQAPNVTLRGFRGIGAGLDMTGMGTAGNYLRYAAVWIDNGAHGARVLNVTGKDMHKVVLVDPDYEGGEVTRTGTPVSQIPNVRDVKLLGIVSDRCWAGVLAGGFDGLEISVSGTYQKAFNSGGVDTTGQPPHLIYTLDRTGFQNPRWGYNLRTHDCFAWDSGVDPQGEPAAAYAIKGVRGWAYDAMTAVNCAGTFDLIQVENVSPGTAVSIDDVYPQAGGRASVAIKNSVGAHIRATVRAKAGGDYGRQLYLEGGAEGCVVEGEFVAAPTTARSTAGTALVRVSGRNNEVRARVRNLGADMRAAIEVQGSEAVGNRVVNPKTAGAFRFPVEIRQGVGALVDYESSQIPAGEESVRVDTVARATKRVDRAPIAAGYIDLFNRPDATSLGNTDDGKSYVIRNGGTFAIGSGMAVATYAPVSGAYALPRGGAKNGVITIKVGAVGTSNDGYMLRTDYDGTGEPSDWLRLDYRESSGEPRPRIRTRVAGGTATNVATAPAGTTLMAGDVLKVTLSGQNVTVERNGTVIITATDTNHVERVASGLAHGSPATGSWKIDEIEFVPA